MEEIFSTHNLSFANKIHYPDISLFRGGHYLLSGSSGSGKSSLLKILNATKNPSTGTVYYQGHDIFTLDTILLRREVLLVGQSVYLFEGTIADNFQAFHDIHETLPPAAPALQQYLELCCVGFPATASCTNMSGGERQRVFLAVALSMKPKVLLLDEPSAALDKETAALVIGQIIAHCENTKTTLVVVSHDPSIQARAWQNTIRLEKSAL